MSCFERASSSVIVSSATAMQPHSGITATATPASLAASRSSRSGRPPYFCTSFSFGLAAIDLRRHGLRASHDRLGVGEQVG